MAKLPRRSPPQMTPQPPSCVDKTERGCRSGCTEENVRKPKPALGAHCGPAMERGQAVPALTRLQTAPGEHLQHHRVLAVDTHKVCVTIFLNSGPLCRLVLRQAVK